MDVRRSFFWFIWALWLVIGTVFYCKVEGLGWTRGVFMAVNIGYSIGFGYPIEKKVNSLYFSSLYVLVGASFVAVALGLFAEKVLDDNEDWFTRMIRRETLKTKYRTSSSIVTRLKARLMLHADVIKAVGLWLLWVLAMMVYAYIGMDWTFAEIQYFAISTLSTGGHWAFDYRSPDWIFPVTAFFAMFGVPIMARAMASVAEVLLVKADLDSTKELLQEDVTGPELLSMRKLNLENGDGSIDRAEYIILNMLRVGADPRLVAFISQRFDELDVDNSGELSIEEITGGKFYFHEGKIMEIGGTSSGKTDQTLRGSRVARELEHSFDGIPNVSAKLRDFLKSNSVADLNASGLMESAQETVRQTVRSVRDFTIGSTIEEEVEEEHDVEEGDPDLVAAKNALQKKLHSIPNFPYGDDTNTTSSSYTTQISFDLLYYFADFDDEISV